ncbi:MAG TPA: NAD(P)-dependent oxidoreductase [Bryobacteraceae bacterium]|nr:NAD(P)-dependent oxidoreductase [Bryobacteraceae bacterium]
MNIAFIGLGRMGSGMVRNLLRAGHQLSVYNRTRSKADTLAAEGANAADSPADAVRHCEAVITMLADDAAVEQCVWGAGGFASVLKAGAVHISSSTISTALARRLAAEHAQRGQEYLSAPVFGRPEAAEAKKLLIVTAGLEEPLSRCRTIFEAIGQQTFVAGREPWQANAVKLCGNFMIASVIESFGETFALLRKAAVAPRIFLETMNALFASPVYANYGRIIAEEQFEPAGFALKLGLKDVRLALEVAQECAAPMPVASVIRDSFISAVAAGQADFDWSSIARIAARNAGL